jgi:Skp family chaperone for outer membrane proteins
MRIFLALSLVAFLVAATPLSAQAAPELVVVNVQQVMRDSTAAQAARTQLQAKQ